jgi:hypothetical protein
MSQRVIFDSLKLGGRLVIVDSLQRRDQIMKDSPTSSPRNYHAPYYVPKRAFPDCRQTADVHQSFVSRCVCKAMMFEAPTATEMENANDIRSSQTDRLEGN